MTDRPLHAVLRHVQKLATAQAADDLSDRDLLDRFVARRDEAAFAALVERHGAMVMSICRRALRHTHDAEDAFQAAFLVLARKAASIRHKDSLGSWLHGVAYHVATNLRRDLARRSAHEESLCEAGQADTAAEVIWREVRAAVDQELTRLPERFRAPLVLCYLDGRTRDEAARELGWGLGTLRGRLERGRELLRSRLGRRGLALAAPVLAAALSERAAAAGIRPALTAATLRAATGRGAAGLAPARAGALALGVLRTMSLAKLKVMALVLLAAALTVGTAALAFYGVRARHPHGEEDSLPPGAVAVPGGRGQSRDPAAPADAPADRSPQPGGLARPDPDPDVTEVAVVATQHFLTDMPEGFTPAHLRLLLTRLSPDLLAVEAPTNVTRPWDFAPTSWSGSPGPGRTGAGPPWCPWGGTSPAIRCSSRRCLPTSGHGAGGRPTSVRSRASSRRAPGSRRRAGS
jgi:RNA polymerase sigma factor (sigma-70 family)